MWPFIFPQISFWTFLNQFTYEILLREFTTALKKKYHPCIKIYEESGLIANKQLAHDTKETHIKSHNQ